MPTIVLQVSGGGGITDILYADLVTAIGGSTLTPGQQYRITDYATKHYMVDAAGTVTPDQVQIDTLTLTGTSGTANVSAAGGLTRLATFATDLTTTAHNFVTAWAANYLAQGIVLTHDTVDLIFTAAVSSVPFAHPVITNATVDLDGTVANTQANGINTGPVEPLIVTAIATNKLHVEAKSATYPSDIIYYDWDPANYLADLSFATAGTTIIPGWKGVITYRRDTLFDNYAPGDWRNCKTRRWTTNAPAWDSGTTYAVGDVVSHAGTDMVYRALAVSTNQEPVGSDDGFWIILLDISTYVYRNASPSTWLGVTSGAGYADFTMFGAGQPRSLHIGSLREDSVTPSFPFSTLLGNNVFLDAATCYECALDSAFYFNTVEAGFIYNVIGMGCARNSIGATCTYNNIGALFDSNSIGAGFSYNVIGAGCAYNYISSSAASNKLDSGFTSNAIGVGFSSNSIGPSSAGNVIGINTTFNVIGASFGSNTIGEELLGNTIGASCSTNSIGARCQNNVIGSGCSTNTIGADCKGNNISAGFEGNTIGSGLLSNVIGSGFLGTLVGADFQNNTVAANAVPYADFAAATLVYATYNCWLYVDAVLGARLYYYSNDVLTFAAVTA